MKDVHTYISIKLKNISSKAMPYHVLRYCNAERVVELNYNKSYVAQMSKIQSRNNMQISVYASKDY
jgi:hypothetical protein